MSKDFAKVEAYLRAKFNNEAIRVIPPKKAGQPAEAKLGGEFIGTIYRDEEDGEVSYAFNMTILDIDLDQV